MLNNKLVLISLHIQTLIYTIKNLCKKSINYFDFVVEVYNKYEI